MPISYITDPAKKLILEVWKGDVTVECLSAHWRSYLADPEVLAIRRTLVDMRGARIRFKGAELKELIHDIVLPVLNGRDWKTAIIVEKNLQFGISRQYQVFADHYSKDAIFNDPQTAYEWLVRLPI